jgi:hypothetical protein
LLNANGTTRGTPLQVLQVGPDFSQPIAPEAICQNVTVKQDWGVWDDFAGCLLGDAVTKNHPAGGFFH